MSRKPWTEDKIKLLTEMWNGNKHSATQIVAVLGREFTRNGVIGKANRLNLMRKRHRNNTYYGWKPPKREKPMEAQATKLARMFGALGGLSHAAVKKVTLPEVTYVPVAAATATLPCDFKVTEYVAKNVMTEGVGFFDRNPACHCAYITQESESIFDLRYCGRPLYYKSWCEEHFNKCFTSTYTRRINDPRFAGSTVR